MLEVSIPTYERPTHLHACLTQIASLNLHPSIQIKVLDNHSTSFDIHDITRDFPSVKVIRHGINYGGNIAILLGHAFSSSPYSMTLGDDDFLLKGVNSIVELTNTIHPNIIVLAPNREHGDCLLYSSKEFLVKYLRDPIAFNSFSHMTSIIYANGMFDYTAALKQVNSVYPHFWQFINI